MRNTITLLAFTFIFTAVLASEKKKTTTVAKKSYTATAATAKSNTAADKDNFIYAGPVEIQAASAVQAPKPPVGNEFFDYIGKSLNEQSVQNMIIGIPGDYDVSNMEGNLFYIWRSSGLIIQFDNKNLLQQIRFMNGKEFFGSYCNSYKSELPKKLDFKMNRSQVEDLLGKPIDISNPSGDERCFATYSIAYNDYNAVVTYNTNSNQEMSAGIEDILIMKSVKKQQSIQNNNSTTQNIIAAKDNIDLGASPSTSYIGKSSADPDVKRYMEQLGNDGQIIKYDESSQFINKKAGVILNFDNQDKVASVMYTSSKIFMGQSFNQYQGDMPSGLNFNMTREQVEKKFGTPAQTSNNDRDDFWAMYAINNGNDAIYISYNTKSAEYMSATISDIRVEKLK
jgi:outer membrane protein assembly factor BamE (lipoprotein component of BamABCDE complex)